MQYINGLKHPLYMLSVINSAQSTDLIEHELTVFCMFLEHAMLMLLMPCTVWDGPERYIVNFM